MQSKAPLVVSRTPAINISAVFRSLVFNVFSLPLLCIAGLLVIGFGLNSPGIFGGITKHLLLMAEIETGSALFWFESMLGSIFVLSLMLAMVAPLKPEKSEAHE